jgi:hypothetical protein
MSICTLPARAIAYKLLNITELYRDALDLTVLIGRGDPQ